jgi:hypothetical protein
MLMVIGRTQLLVKRVASLNAALDAPRVRAGGTNIMELS